MKNNKPQSTDPEFYSEPAGKKLAQQLQERSLMLDGPMGTMIQQHPLEEPDFRGTRFTDHPSDLKGNNELLTLTRPELIEQIHLDFLQAGSDIIETNTFNATAISQADYQMEPHVRELNIAAAQLARQAIEKIQQQEPQRTCFIAGAVGPTNRTASRELT